VLEKVGRENVTSIAGARNTSTQVKPKSLLDLNGFFDPIKTVLDKESYGAQIAYVENETDSDNEKKIIPVETILAYLECFHLESWSDGSHPTSVYSSKAKVVDNFEKNKDEIYKYVPLLPKILALRDIIYREYPEVYNSNNGKFGLLSGVNARVTRPLNFISDTSSYDIPEGFIFPILAAFRLLVKIENGNVGWKKDPIIVFSQKKNELIKIV
jgi:hypothetical protein